MYHGMEEPRKKGLALMQAPMLPGLVSAILH